MKFNVLYLNKCLNVGCVSTENKIMNPLMNRPGYAFEVAKLEGEKRMF